MNNESNNNVNNENNTFSFLPQNDNPTTSNTNETNVVNNVPGANLTPISAGATPVAEPLNNPVPSTPEPVAPTNNVETNPIMPETSNQPMNPTPELNTVSSSPFDIGLNNSNPTPNLINANNLSPDPTMSVNNNSMPSFDIPSNESQRSEPLPINTGTNNVPLTNPTPQNGMVNNSDNVVSVGQYLGNMLLFSIPFVGIIILIVKAINNNNQNLRNYARAQLLLMAIMVGVGFIISIIFGAAFASMITALS